MAKPEVSEEELEIEVVEGGVDMNNNNTNQLEIELDELKRKLVTRIDTLKSSYATMIEEIQHEFASKLEAALEQYSKAVQSMEADMGDRIAALEVKISEAAAVIGVIVKYDEFVVDYDGKCQSFGSFEQEPELKEYEFKVFSSEASDALSKSDIRKMASILLLKSILLEEKPNARVDVSFAEETKHLEECYRAMAMS